MTRHNCQHIQLKLSHNAIRNDIEFWNDYSFILLNKDNGISIYLERDAQLLHVSNI